MKRRPLKSIPVSIDSFLEQFLKQRGWDTKLQEYKIWTHWETIVGPQLAKKCSPKHLKNGLLTLEVSQSTWMTQLQFIKPQLIDKIKTSFGVHLKDIKLKLYASGSDPNA
ncbi:MAG: hypothetical protein A3B70_04270 [Deltaproteobacteria bacterium RIFCSPHIGHO2_02_FULL_40_11]|nr:MAG: hypothetical protein A3B70_04270 [Deltaproteobacteria bacterium RIFCSPHIGHO2_02_FULL_40_11]